MVTINGEVIAHHKGVQTVDAATGEVNTILMPIATLEHLGYNVEDDVPVRIAVDEMELTF